MTTIQELFPKYLNNQCSPEEVKQLLSHFNVQHNEEQLRRLITQSLEDMDEEDVESLYETLETSIIPTYYTRDQSEIPYEWISLIKESLKTNIPQFSTRRMVKEYVERLYVKALK